MKGAHVAPLNLATSARDFNKKSSKSESRAVHRHGEKLVNITRRRGAPLTPDVRGRRKY